MLKTRYRATSRKRNPIPPERKPREKRVLFGYKKHPNKENYPR
jgi:hypothetical protein